VVNILRFSPGPVSAVPLSISRPVWRRQRRGVKWGFVMLVAVVGPSGAGKDTLMAGARMRIEPDARFRFVRRSITRAASAGGEDHEPVDRDAFLRSRDTGGFALWWEAHGLLYGIPRDIELDLAAGRCVVANMSRGALSEAASRYELLVLEITAPPAVLAARLAARGREDPDTVAARLAREAPLPPALRIRRVVNDGRVEQGVAEVVRALLDAAGEGRRG
jgi:phosphonate metabolism protein PhnN/1,5-bisphosphokinase (PRPP-forming)